MSVPRLFYCTVAGLVVATLLSFLFGASGLLNYHRLQAYEGRVATGIAALEERHTDLERLANLLRTEPELLRLLARDTGYYRADELVIRVGPQPTAPAAATTSPYAPDFPDVGPLVQPQLPVPRDPFNVLALGLFLGLGMFAALTVKRVLRTRAGQAGGADGAADRGAVAGSVEDTFPADGWSEPGTARGDFPAAGTHDDVAGPPPAAGPDRRLRPPEAAEDVAQDIAEVAASGADGTERAAGSQQAAGDGGAGPGPRRKRRRARHRRGEVTVYRL